MWAHLNLCFSHMNLISKSHGLACFMKLQNRMFLNTSLFFPGALDHRDRFSIYNKPQTVISTLYHAVLTLMVFKLLLCLSSPNFPSGFAVLFLTETN